MRTYNYQKSFMLTGPEIDAFSDDMEEALVALDVERQNRLRIRLSIEESLLRMRDHFGEGKTVSASIVKRFGRGYIEVDVEGEAFNPMSSVENELDDMSSSLLSSMGVTPQYSYTGRTGSLKINLPLPETNPVFKLVIAVIVGIIAGIAGRVVLSDTLRVEVIEMFLNPVYDLWSRILNVMSGPVIFFMVMTTVLNTGRISKKGANNIRIIGRYFLFSFIMAMAAMLSAFLFYDLAWGFDSMDAETTTGFLQEILNIVPENFFSPFMESNTPQLLLIAFVLGGVMNIIGEQAHNLRRIVRQINLVGMQITKWISKLVPILVCIFLALEIWVARTELLSGIWYCLLISFLVSVICVDVVIVYVSVTKKIRPVKLMKKLADTFLLTLRSGSLDTAYGRIEKCCISSLGIERSYATVSIPNGLVLYMPVNTIGTILFMSFVAVKSGVSVTPLWCVTAVVLSVLLFVATPPVPGANLLAYVALFARLGIPGEALIDAMIFDIVFGIFASACNQLLLQLELVVQADRTGFLDEETFYA